MAQAPTVVKTPEAAEASTGTTPAEVAAATPAPARIDMELPDSGWDSEVSDVDFAAEDAQVTPKGQPKTPEAAAAPAAATTDDEDDEDDDDDEIDEQAAEVAKPTDGTDAATVAAAEAAKPKGKDARIAELEAQIAKFTAPGTTEPNADIRLKVAEKNLAEEQMSNTQIRNAGLELEQKLLDQTNPETGDPYTPDEANLMARRATLQATRVVESRKAYNEGVQHNQQVIQTELQRGFSEFPMFVEKLPDGTPNPAYDEEAANLAGQHLLDAYLTADSGKQDKDGRPVPLVVGIKRSPYEILKSVADQAARYQQKATAAARSSADEQSANADIPAFGNTTHKKVDPAGADFDTAFDELD